ncbi:phosphoglycerate mutase family protein [Penicillium brasilianum]|uniref:Phosphoglycerate mutase family protein n=1 Tax=Penicillium brasilianum TaxID=104259 RepID=A0A1S9RA75_PENBI|nr:phosphoglycerate mutase family protein [Penicillium brasilianum]
MLLRSAFAYGVFCLAAVSARSPPKVFMIRHGEKPPNRDDHGLTLDGIKRSQCLRDIFGRDSGYDIGHIMAPTVKWNGEHRRAYMTVLPLANDLGLEVDAHCSRKDTQCVADTIQSYDGPGNILISWRHKNMGQIQEHLGSHDPLEYPEDRFDLIWTIPFPYEEVTDIESEFCPGLGSRPALVAQY